MFFRTNNWKWCLVKVNHTEWDRTRIMILSMCISNGRLCARLDRLAAGKPLDFIVIMDTRKLNFSSLSLHFSECVVLCACIGTWTLKYTLVHLYVQVFAHTCLHSWNSEDNVRIFINHSPPCDLMQSFN